MSPGGIYSGQAKVWMSIGMLGIATIPIGQVQDPPLHPVISLNANIIVSGDGTIDSPWIVQK